MPGVDADNTLANLARATYENFQKSGDIVAVAVTIVLLRKLLETPSPSGDLRRAALLVFLGRALRERCERTRGEDDAHAAVRCLTEAARLATLAGARPLCGMATSTLANALFVRFELLGVGHDLDESIRLQRDAAGDRPVGVPARASALLKLARAIFARFELLGAKHDLEEGIGLHREVLTLLHASHPARPASLHHLAHALLTRFKFSGALDDLNEAVHLHRMALVLRPGGHRDHISSLNDLANALYVSFKRLGAPEVLNEGIRLHRAGLALRPEAHAGRPGSLNNLAQLVFARFEQHGEGVDLDEAVHLHAEAVDLLPPADAHRSGYASNLANVLYTRFKQRGVFEDLDEAVRLHRAALGLRGPGHAEHASSLNNLAATLSTRFSQLGAVDDLQEAIDLNQQAVHLRPFGHSDRPSALSNLAYVLSARFKLFGETADLDEVIALNRDALALRPLGHPDRPTSLHNLANALMTCYQQTGSSHDFDSAIELYRAGLELHPPGHPDHYVSLMNLGSVYRAQFSRSGDQNSAVQARLLTEDALGLTPPGHAERSWCLCVLAMLHSHPHTSFTNVDVALSYLFDGIEDNYRSPQLRLSDAVQTLSAIEDLPEDYAANIPVPKLLDVYVLTIQLLPRVAYFGLNLRSRLTALRTAECLATDAAVLALHCARTEEALEILDAGRAIFWTQALRLRTAFDDVRPDLRDELLQLARQLERDSFAPPSHLSRAWAKVTMEQEEATRRKQSKRFDELIEQVRALPGLGRFMLHQEFLALAEAAKCGLVVVLIASQRSCEALVVTKYGTAERVPLSLDMESLLRLRGNFDTTNARRMDTDERLGVMPKRNGMSPTLYALKELWEKVAHPVIIRIGLTRSSGRQRPRLWWCPTGPFTFMPIHAAGIYSGPGASCCSDYFVSSYTPTLAALLNVRRTSSPVQRATASILAAAVPEPFRGGHLPATVREIDAIKVFVPEELFLPLPRDPRHGVTVETMSKKLREAVILHLSCHGIQSISNPLESGFILSDGMLTVSQIMENPLPRAFLAFLSACETARGDKYQPDQTIHLAATMLFAGFRSVVATMWTMADSDGPAVATAVYKELFKDWGEAGEYLDPDDVPYALDAAVRSMRERGLPPSRWATFVHLGV